MALRWGMAAAHRRRKGEGCRKLSADGIEASTDSRTISGLPMLPVANWFRFEAVNEATIMIEEPHVHELLRANTWHVRGGDRDLWVDCGLGVAALHPALNAITDREPILVLSHAHLDHMGSAYEFRDCWAHPLEPVTNPPPGALRGPELASELELAEELPALLISAIPHEHYDPSRYRLRARRLAASAVAIIHRACGPAQV